MSFKTFEEIDAWQEARKLSRIIRKFCQRPAVKNDWSWTDQILRAVLSIMANIAEGNDAGSNPEFARFLSYAKRSAAEVRSHLYYGLDAGYINKQEFEEVADCTKKIGAQIAMLMRYIRKYDDRRDLKSSNE